MNIDVSLGERSYSVRIEAGLLTDATGTEQIAALAGNGKVCLVTHPALRAAYADPLNRALQCRGIETVTITIPAGERFKTLRTVERLYGHFLTAGLDRHALVVSVGGGVLGDVTGFAAATYLRGVRFVQAPTTLLAQVDAAIGGKTGVDLPEGKNLVGAFHQPSAVLIDPHTLRTLPMREMLAGLAEVIKYGIIYDKEFYQAVIAGLPGFYKRDPVVLSRIITRSCEIKAAVVGQDETEQGLRAILNFGHTVGHAVEAVTHYRRYKHGEAIAIGMVSAARIGELMDVTPPNVTLRIAADLRAARLPVAFPVDLDLNVILAAMRRDKKAKAGKLRFVLARHIGEVTLRDDVAPEIIRDALIWQTGI